MNLTDLSKIETGYSNGVVSGLRHTATNEVAVEVNFYADLVSENASIIAKESCIFRFKEYLFLSELDVLKLAVKYAVEHNNYKAALFSYKYGFAWLGLERKEVAQMITPENAMHDCVMKYSYHFKKKAEQKQKQQTNQELIKRIKQGDERAVQLSLQRQLGGHTEVQTPYGRIDLLTENKIIEIKTVKQWKSGIGQLLSYGQSYPDHEKVLYLFGDVDTINISDVKHVLATLDISLETIVDT